MSINVAFLSEHCSFPCAETFRNALTGARILLYNDYICTYGTMQLGILVVHKDACKWFKWRKRLQQIFGMDAIFL